MASVQYHRSCEESCHQQTNQQHHGSLGQKVSGLFKGHHHSNSTATTQQYHGSRRKEHKKNLFEKIKDGLSGHSSDSNSSSDSDSDNENSHKRKN